jgi:DNA modification methylase
VTKLGTAHVIRGDARTLPLPDDSVDLIISSPPYFALRSYQDGGEHYAGQIGDEPTPQEFIEALLAVTRECVRVLRPAGSMWINLGDKYVADNRGSSDDPKRGDAKYAPAGPAGYPTGDMPKKSLMGLPWRYANRCVDELGLILRAEVIWSKPNGLPESVVDRVRRSHEQWFHFTREPRYFSAVDEIREDYSDRVLDRQRYAGRDDVPLSKDRGDRHDGNPARGILGHGHRGLSPLGKLPGSVWTIATEPLRVPDHLGIDHFAAFPTEWPKRIIQGWAPLTGVCTACEEGRRPATVAEQDTQGRTTNGPKNEVRRGLEQGTDQVAMIRSGVRTVRRTTITGYVCGCNDLIRTPTGRAAPGQGPTGSRPAGDPSKVTGRAGFDRDRADGAGTRVITRWEQRHEAAQLRAADHRAQEHMRDEAGPAYAHYIRTDAAGARPIPETLRSHWRQQGWLTQAPPFEAPPTRPAVVLDMFGGTGTVAMVAKALGMVGITVDLSADYCRIATWRTNDRDQLAKVLGIGKVTGAAAAADRDHDDLFSLMEEA